MRVASLLPSATEIVCALGHSADLVARSSECDYPEGVRTLPAVMQPKTLDGEAASRAIDARVRAARGSGESLYRLDVSALRALRPELILTQDLCSVCSVTEGEVAEACSVAGIAPEVVSLSPRNLAEVWSSTERVAAALGDREAGRLLVEGLRARVPPRPPARRLRTAIVEWLDPPILAGLWAPDIVRVAGGEPIGPASGEVGSRTDWEAVRAWAPEVLILSPCSFSVERTLEELGTPELASAIGRAAPAGGLVVADEAYFSRPGPRLAAGVELVADLLREREPRGPMPIARWCAAPERWDA